MLRTAGQIHRLVVSATDGDIGEIAALYFDDQRWTVRHLVVDTGKWLPGRKVLISPVSVTAIQDDSARIAVELTRDRVRDSPEVDTDRPVSRQKEEELAQYYGHGPYWTAVDAWGGTYYPPAPAVPPAALATPAVEQQPGLAPVAAGAQGENPGERHHRPPDGDPHLRSTAEVKGYHVQAVDGAIGHVASFVIDVRSWRITHVIIDTSNWPGGRSVVVPVSWIEHVEWATMVILLSASTAEIRSRPHVETTSAIQPDLESRLLTEDATGR
jgi:hypothetical protein